MSKSKKPRLKAAVGILSVVVACGILGHAFFWKSESKAPPQEPETTTPITQLVSSAKASEPKEPANVATPFEPEDASNAPSGVDLSLDSIRRMTVEPKSSSIKKV